MEHRIFSQSDLDRIAAAVREAEGKTSGEIVPYFVEESDRYHESVWKGGIVFAALAGIIIVAASLLSTTWIGLGPIEIILILLGSTALGMILTHFLPFLKRLFAGNDLLEQRVAQRAAQAFIAEEVFETRDRTGILLFLSLLERKVIVVGDSGINAKVHQTEWQDVVDRVIRGINTGRPTDGLIDAIHQCGTLLKLHGVKRRKRDVNELANRLRIGSSRKSNGRRKKR